MLGDEIQKLKLQVRYEQVWALKRGQIVYKKLYDGH